MSFDFEFDWVVRQAPLARSRDHGERHWKAVAYTGLILADHVGYGVDRELVVLFGLFHDSMRENENSDPGHGSRAATLARLMLGAELDADRLGALALACRHHSDGLVSDDPYEAVCWDADRLNLWRFGDEPDQSLLSTGVARRIAATTARLFPLAAPSWDDLFAAAAVGARP